MNQNQVYDLGQAFINLGVGMILTGYFGPLLQTRLPVPYPVLAMIGLIDGMLCIYVGLRMRRLNPSQRRFRRWN